MECNKDEAIRARDIAEKKMKDNDFQGARKIALKAKNLYPELDNINQLLSTCDVHCSAHERLVGVVSEKDWYGILQVEKFADELTIKKQYRRLALILHPDKNRFPGAEGAFKLISEANALLSDPAKKSIYDSKVRGSIASAQLQATQTTASVGQGGFWTSCPFCKARYLYGRVHINKSMICHTCTKRFTAYEVSAQGVPRGPISVQPGDQHVPVKPNSRQAAAFQEKVITNEGNPKMGVQNGKKSSASHAGLEEIAKKKTVRAETGIQRGSGLETAAEAKGNSKTKETGTHNPNSTQGAKEGGLSNVDPSLKETIDLRNKNRKRSRKQAVESSESCDESDSDIASSDHTDEVVLNCPDPEFSDFDKERHESRFHAGDIWACYDTLNNMPRYYAKVKSVRVSPFELSITWFEAVPIDKSYANWVHEELPVGCGTFKLGTTEKTPLRLSFSHQVHCEKGKKRGSFVIYPRKGEVWAIFKDWDASWSSDPESHKEFKYEVVEVLSDFVAGTGLKVCYLDKVDGFVCLFQRASQSKISLFVIGPNELYKFSHLVPSTKMAGTERVGVPIGSFELDPASLPSNSDDLYYPGKEKMAYKNMDPGPGAHFSPNNSAKKKGKSVVSDDMSTPEKFVDLEGTRGEVSQTRKSPRGQSNGKQKGQFK